MATLIGGLFYGRNKILTVLCPTGARPEAFARCVEQMRAQDYAGRVKWVIVDDGPISMPTPGMPSNWSVIHVRPAPLWQPGQNTQSRNLREGLEWVKPDDKLVIIEDDDQVAPWWLSRCAEWLEHDDLVGEMLTPYRHLNGKTREARNAKHASLCATAMKGEAIEYFRCVLEKHKRLIDVRLWEYGGKLYPHEGGVIGVKGWPGRPGIGIGHRL